MNVEPHLWLSLQGKGTVSNGNVQFHKSNKKYVLIPAPHTPDLVLVATAMSKKF